MIHTQCMFIDIIQQITKFELTLFVFLVPLILFQDR